MNGDTSKHQDRFIVGAILILGFTCSICATVLIFKGYNADLIAGGVVSAISGLCGYLGGRRQSTAQPDITVSGDPPKVEVGKTE